MIIVIRFQPCHLYQVYTYKDEEYSESQHLKREWETAVGATFMILENKAMKLANNIDWNEVIKEKQQKDGRGALRYMQGEFISETRCPPY